MITQQIYEWFLFLSVAPCRKLGAPARSRITQGGFRHNENMKFECDPDYYLQGKNVLTCSDGTWNGAPPTCLGKHDFYLLSHNQSGHFILYPLPALSRQHFCHSYPVSRIAETMCVKDGLHYKVSLITVGISH